MSIYTKTGDHGDTGLFGNRRVPKHDLRIRAYGTVDELSSFLGLLRSESLPRILDTRLQEIQEALFDVGADLATENGQSSVARARACITRIEEWIDASEQHLAPLRSFILPGGVRAGALLHVARTVCRRAEREVWELSERDAIPSDIGTLLNRLSDWLFVEARAANARAGVADTPWHRHEV